MTTMIAGSPARPQQTIGRARGHMLGLLTQVGLQGCLWEKGVLGLGQTRKVVRVY